MSDLKLHLTLTALVKDGEYLGALQTLLTEAARARQFGFTESELDRARQNLIRGMEIAFNERDNLKSGSFASEYVRHILTGESIPGIEFEYELTKRALPEISLEQVNRLGDSFMEEENRVVSISGPEDTSLPLPNEDEVAAIFAAVGQMRLEAYEDSVDQSPLLSVEPEPGSIIAESFDDETDITKWTLSNGVQVVLKPTDYKNDQILLRGSSPGGSSLSRPMLTTFPPF